MSVWKEIFRDVLFENKNPVSAVQEFSAESETVKEKEKFVGSRQMSKNSCGQSQFQFSTAILTGICGGSRGHRKLFCTKMWFIPEVTFTKQVGQGKEVPESAKGNFA